MTEQIYPSKFSQFDIHRTPYKVINGQEIPVYTFIPKGFDTKGGKCPVIVHFHRGFLITGSALFPDWATQWSLDYAILHNAIIVGPEHRFLPESTGLDILSDINDFWAWIASSLSTFLSSTSSTPIIPDLERILCYGESAGGYLAVQSVLNLLTTPLTNNIGELKVKAVITAYPKVDNDNPEYCTPRTTRSPMGAPQLDPKILDNWLTDMKPGRIVTAAFPPARMQLAVVVTQQGRLCELMGSEEVLFPLRRIERLKVEGLKGMQNGKEKWKGKGFEVPFLFAYHGKEDSAVPYQEMEKLVEAWGSAFGVEKVWGVLEKGDHGFDGGADLETPWLKGGLEKVTRAWIGGELKD